MGGGAIQAGNQDDFSIMGQVNFATGPTTIFSSDMLFKILKDLISNFFGNDLIFTFAYVL
jgi:hypothetical protein